MFRRRWGRRRGSVLLPSLFILLSFATLVAATLPLAATGYDLAREEQDRVTALAAAEAGLNWEIGRIRAGLWGRNDQGLLLSLLGLLVKDLWPTETSSPPSSATEHALKKNAAGVWTHRFLVGASKNIEQLNTGDRFDIISEGQVRSPAGHIVRRRVRVTAVVTSTTSRGLIGGVLHTVLGGSNPLAMGDWQWREIPVQ